MLYNIPSPVPAIPPFLGKKSRVKRFLINFCYKVVKSLFLIFVLIDQEKPRNIPPQLQNKPLWLHG